MRSKPIDKLDEHAHRWTNAYELFLMKASNIVDYIGNYMLTSDELGLISKIDWFRHRSSEVVLHQTVCLCIAVDRHSLPSS